MKFWLPLLIIVFASMAASASTDIAGSIGAAIGFSGRFPIVGGMGVGSSPPPTGCGAGVIDASAGCPLPMLGM
jgi:hypothetical protein